MIPGPLMISITSEWFDHIKFKYLPVGFLSCWLSCWISEPRLMRFLAELSTVGNLKLSSYARRCLYVVIAQLGSNLICKTSSTTSIPSMLKWLSYCKRHSWHALHYIIMSALLSNPELSSTASPCPKVSSSSMIYRHT